MDIKKALDKLQSIDAKDLKNIDLSKFKEYNLDRFKENLSTKPKYLINSICALLIVIAITYSASY